MRVCQEGNKNNIIKGILSMTNKQILDQVMRESEAAEEATRTATAIVSAFLQSIDKAFKVDFLHEFDEFLYEILESENVSSNSIIAVAEIMADNIEIDLRD